MIEISAETIALIKSISLAAWIGFLLVAERLWPMAERVGGWSRVFRNAGLGVLNGVFSKFAVLPITLTAASMSLGWRPEEFQVGWWILVDLLILDCWIYFWHRINHQIPFLWRFHQVHHLDDFLDASSAVRFHFGEVILSALVRAVVIIALDIPFTTVVIAETLILASAAFQHSNLRLPAGLEKALSYVVVTPSIHWIHHHAVRHDTDSNYANLLSVWDRLFGTRSETLRTRELTIGLENDQDVALPALLLKPLQSPGSSGGSASSRGPESDR